MTTVHATPDERIEREIHMHNETATKVSHVDNGDQRTTTFGRIYVTDTEILAVTFAGDASTSDSTVRYRVMAAARSVQRGEALPDGAQWQEDTITTSWDDGRVETKDAVKTTVVGSDLIAACTTSACDLFGDAHVLNFDDDTPIHTIGLGALVQLEQWEERPWSLRVDDAEIDDIADMQALAEQVSRAAKLCADLNASVPA